jgi:dTDP-4-amino-4,6-dideoxygalactose transaminase
MIVSGEPLLSPPLLLRAILAGDEQRPGQGSQRQRSLSHRLGGQALLFAYGRQALAAGLRESGAGQILVPAYICDTVVDGIATAGWRWRYYPLRDGLAPDWEWLERNPDPADRALLLVHYFGFPSEVARAVDYAEACGVALIEDCAHAFLTAAATTNVGRAGYAAVYSWRKFIPLVRGGALVMANAPDGDRPGGDATVRSSGVRGAAQQVAKWTIFKSGSRRVVHMLGPALSDEPEDAGPGDTAAASLSRFERRTLAAELSRLERIAARRRDNYSSLLGSLSRSRGPAPLTGALRNGVVPWCLPVVVEGGVADSESLVEHLLRNGIGAWSWPELPRDVARERFPNEWRLAARTVCLPVHQSLDARHMRYVARVLDRWQARTAVNSG